MKKSDQTHYKTIEWLLSFDNPSLRYLVLTELLDFDKNNKEIVALKQQIPGSPDVVKILNKMHPDGYWLVKRYDGRYVGDGVEYTSCATTHYCLSCLAELGMDNSYPVVAKAADRYLNLQQTDGDWWMHLSCLNGQNIHTFLKLGYRHDKRLQKAIDLMLDTGRTDGGFLCDLHEKKTKKKKSCIRGSAKMLLALSLMPEYWEHPRCKALVEYFLNRGGTGKSKNHEKPVNRDVTLNSFPPTYSANAWEILLSLSRMGYGNDERLQTAWGHIDSKKNEKDRYILHFTPAQSPWKIGKKGLENPWITFYILLAKKLRGKSGQTV